MLKASEGLLGSGLSTIALNAPADLGVLPTNPALTNAIYAAPAPDVSSLVNSDMLKASEGLLGSGLSTIALNAPADLGVLPTNPALTNAIYAAPAPDVSSFVNSDVMNANLALPHLSLPTTSLYNFAGSDSLRYGGSTEYPLPPLATPPQPLAPECALCSGVKL
jgi:hypothetical protein